MGQAVKDRSEICPLPPGPLKDVKRHLKPRTIFMAVSLTLILTASGLVYVWTPKQLPIIIPPPEDDPIIQYGFISIDGDANFSDAALLEGWSGDGSPENPFIIDGLDIEFGGEFGHCISISHTRVSFIIRNCNLTGAHDPRPRAPGMIFPNDWGAGIELWNVTSGELVNNTCNSNAGFGIALHNSQYITVVNNTCNYNDYGVGIHLVDSTYNTVVRNTCDNNCNGINSWGSHNIVANNTCSGNEDGIVTYGDSNTVTDNICSNNNNRGIYLGSSDSNTVVNNTCTSNMIGIYLIYAHFNTLATNICNNNRIGVYISESISNTVFNNICTGNAEHDIYLYNSNIITEITIIVVPLLIGFAGSIVLGAGWRMAKLSRVVSKGE